MLLPSEHIFKYKNKRIGKLESKLLVSTECLLGKQRSFQRSLKKKDFS